MARHGVGWGPKASVACMGRSDEDESGEVRLTLEGEMKSGEARV